MSRSLSAEMLAVATADIVRPIYLVKAEFDSTPPEDRNLYLWSGFGDLTFNGKNYLGVGNLLSISAVDESTDLTATGASIVLSGIQSTLLAIARDEDYQGRPITIYLGALDDTGDGFIEYCEGNTLKYLHRWRYKEHPVQDLRKARWYLDKMI